MSWLNGSGNNIFLPAAATNFAATNFAALVQPLLPRERRLYSSPLIGNCVLSNREASAWQLQMMGILNLHPHKGRPRLKR
jgi:hypothetical protein